MVWRPVQLLWRLRSRVVRPTSTYTGKHADQTDKPKSPPLRIDYAPNQAAPKTIGRVVTTVAGATLYTFDDDQNGESSCYDDCAKHWPPLIALSTAKAHWRMSLTRRADGQQQWLYDGKPLYTYVNDTMPAMLTATTSEMPGT